MLLYTHRHANIHTGKPPTQKPFKHSASGVIRGAMCTWKATGPPDRGRGIN